MGNAIAVTVVRAMRLAEADAVAALLLRAYDEHLRAFDASIAATYGREIADVRSRTATCAALVAEQAGVLVGSVTLVADAADDGHPWPDGGAVLRLLAVDPPARGHGVGALLAEACVELARNRGTEWVGLHTAPTMRAARGLYERMGFVRTPEHDFDPAAYYGDARDSSEARWGLAYVLPLRP